MKTNGMTLKSRGQETVYIYGDKFKKTVYYTEDGKYFVKSYGELVEVFRGMMSFSTTRTRE